MPTIKEELLKQIEFLDEEKARKVLDFTQSLLVIKEVPPVLKKLAESPDFEVNLEGKKFEKFKAVKCKGKPASDTLLEDRR